MALWTRVFAPAFRLLCDLKNKIGLCGGLKP